MYSPNGVKREVSLLESTQPPDIIAEAGTPNVGAFGWTTNDLVHLKDLVGWVQIAMDSANSATESAQFASEAVSFVQGQVAISTGILNEVTLIGDNINLLSSSLNSRLDGFDPKFELFSVNYNLFSSEYSDFVVKYDDFITKWEEGGGEIDLSAYVRKENNLSDLANISQAKINLGVDRFTQSPTFVRLQSSTGTGGAQLVLADGGGFAIQTNAGVTIPISISSGGTGAMTAAEARTNLEVERLDQKFSTETQIWADSAKDNHRLTLQTDGNWGVYGETAGLWRPLGIEQGGTGGTTLAATRSNLQIDRINQGPSYITISGGNVGSSNYFSLDSSGPNWGVHSSIGESIPLPVVGGGTGAMTIEGARENLGVETIQRNSNASFITAPGSRMALSIDTNGRWGGYDMDVGYIPLSINSGGTGANNITQARQNLSVYSKNEIDDMVDHILLAGKITTGQRILLGNPYGAYVPVIVEVEIFRSGVWFNPRWIYNSSSNQSFGVTANFIEGAGIILQAGNFMGTSSVISGDGSGQTGNITGPVQYRVQIWKVKL